MPSCIHRNFFFKKGICPSRFEKNYIKNGQFSKYPRKYKGNNVTFITDFSVERWVTGVRFKVMWLCLGATSKSPLTLGCRNSMVFPQFPVPLSGW
jgi:hypothetical protein